jgi:hypothetical protein
VLPDLKLDIAAEREQLHRLLQVHRVVLEKCRRDDPSIDELAALAAILHAFYNGVENMFKRTAEAVDGRAPRGEHWHSALLESMANSSMKRPAVISRDLYICLREYLDFRHVFRHAYSFELRWLKMKSLIFGMEAALTSLESEIDRFLQDLERGQ